MTNTNNIRTPEEAAVYFVQHFRQDSMWDGKTPYERALEVVSQAISSALITAEAREAEKDARILNLVSYIHANTTCN